MVTDAVTLNFVCEKCPTIQEHMIANVLDSLEVHYAQRVELNMENLYYYTWDFFLGEDLGMVIQADGINGHGQKYSLSDDVMQCRVDFIKNILHIDAETEHEIREVLIRALASVEQ